MRPRLGAHLPRPSQVGQGRGRRATRRGRHRPGRPRSARRGRAGACRAGTPRSSRGSPAAGLRRGSGPSADRLQHAVEDLVEAGALDAGLGREVEAGEADLGASAAGGRRPPRGRIARAAGDRRAPRRRARPPGTAPRRPGHPDSGPGGAGAHASGRRGGSRPRWRCAGRPGPRRSPPGYPRSVTSASTDVAAVGGLARPSERPRRAAVLRSCRDVAVERLGDPVRHGGQVTRRLLEPGATFGPSASRAPVSADSAADTTSAGSFCLLSSRVFSVP